MAMQQKCPIFTQTDENLDIYSTPEPETEHAGSFPGHKKTLCGNFQNFHFMAFFRGSKSNFWPKTENFGL